MITLLQGDCREKLKELQAGSVHCVVTSPPYWGLRDYGVDGQLGLEATPEEYVGKMVEVFREVWRVLRDDGTLWLNIGDSYNANQGSGFNAHQKDRPHLIDNRVGQQAIPVDSRNTKRKQPSGLKSKDLVGIPWRVAFALQADGWWLRSDIIWHKPNPIPESCTDRPTKSHEYLFLLTKSPRYYYDADAIREPSTGQQGAAAEFFRETGKGREGRCLNETPSGNELAATGRQDAGHRNRRDVWTIATQAYSAAHFATFPEKLVEPCVLAGTSEEGCCAECGAPWERVVEREKLTRERPNDRTARHEAGNGISSCGNTVAGVDVKTTGWQPTCTCNAKTIPCVVLDPFTGTSTVGVVARKQGCRYIGIELSEEYMELGRKRLGGPRLW